MGKFRRPPPALLPSDADRPPDPRRTALALARFLRSRQSHRAMPDWKRIVGDKLGTLPLRNGRRDEVIEELAQQLESAYEEALAKGSDKEEAMRCSLAQFKDWEKLRSQLFLSVEGTRLPVWEQNGFFAPRRMPVWIALALTLLLLAIPSFRQALAILPVPGSDLTSWGSRVLSEKELRRIEQSGDKQKYARSLAFVALHSRKEDDLRALHAAERAIALDPQLTWISAKVSHATYQDPGYDPHPWNESRKSLIKRGNQASRGYAPPLYPLRFAPLLFHHFSLILVFAQPNKF